MACPGGCAKDSYRLIHNVWAMAGDEKAINNRPTIMLKLALFIIISLSRRQISDIRKNSTDPPTTDH
jgi:hypothetical protein